MFIVQETDKLQYIYNYICSLFRKRLIFILFTNIYMFNVHFSRYSRTPIYLLIYIYVCVFRKRLNSDLSTNLYFILAEVPGVVSGIF